MKEFNMTNVFESLNMAIVEDKITTAIQQKKRAPGRMGLFFMYVRIFNESDRKALSDYESKYGEAAAEAWLCSVLVNTGRYVSDGEFVAPIR